MEIMFKYMTVFGIMESMMLAEYDSSLVKLKFRAESGTKPAGDPVDASGKKK